MRNNSFSFGDNLIGSLPSHFKKRSLEFKSNLQISISEKFSDILTKYQLNDEAGKFTKFMSDYFVARGCNVKVKSVT